MAQYVLTKVAESLTGFGEFGHGKIGREEGPMEVVVVVGTQR
jgi:hypothetical protein